MFKENSNSNNIAIFTVLTVIFWSIPCLFDITFSSIDDYSCLWILSGRYTGSITPMAPFIGYVHSVIISSLYAISDSLEWYSFAFFLIMYICFMLLSHLIFKAPLNRRSKIALLLLLLSVQIYFELRPHNGNIAIETSITSFLLLYNSKHRAFRLIAYVLFFASTQMRLLAAFIPYMIAFPVYLFNVKQKKDIVKTALTFSIILLISGVTFLTNRSVYANDAAWNRFSEVNSIRGYIVDNPSNNDVYNVITNSKDSISYNFIEKTRIGDPHTLNVERLRPYVDYLKSRSVHTAISLVHWYYGDYKKIGIWVVMLLFVIVAYQITATKDKRSLLVFTLSTLMVFAGNFFLMSQSRPKERLLIPFILMFTFVLCSIVTRNKRIKTIIIPLVCLSLSCFFAMRSIDGYTETKQLLCKQEQIESQLSRIPYDKVFACSISPYPEIFDARKSVYGTKVYEGDWMMSTPLAPDGMIGIKPLVEGLPILIPADKTKDIVNVFLPYIKCFYKKDMAIAENGNYGEYKLIKLVSNQ